MEFNDPDKAKFLGFVATINCLLNIDRINSEQAQYILVNQLKKDNLIAFKYCDENGNVNESSNPNGALENIAGIYPNFSSNIFDATSMSLMNSLSVISIKYSCVCEW